MRAAVCWPDLKFGPVNLWVVVPADRFYASQEEQERLAWNDEAQGNQRPIERSGEKVTNPKLATLSKLMAMH